MKWEGNRESDNVEDRAMAAAVVVAGARVRGAQHRHWHHRDRPAGRLGLLGINPLTILGLLSGGGAHRAGAAGTGAATACR
jgi:hypothetical protein